MMGANKFANVIQIQRDVIKTELKMNKRSGQEESYTIYDPLGLIRPCITSNIFRWHSLPFQNFI